MALLLLTIVQFPLSALAQTDIPKTRREPGGAQATIEKTRPSGTSAETSSAAATTTLKPSDQASLSQNAPPGTRAVVTGLHVASSGKVTNVVLSAASMFEATVFTLPNPYRVIVDLPNVEFDMPQALARQAAGVVKAVRFGLMAPGRARLVLETTGPVALTHGVAPASPGSSVTRLTIALTTATEQEFTAKLRPEPPPDLPSAEPATEPRRPTGKPVVMIDPGHGGIDGGATGPAMELEKDIVLAVALQLRARLQATGAYDVRMTRADDRFLSLDQRVRVSRDAGASLFVSIHADAVPDNVLAGSVHGASVYSLSEKASNSAAQRLADKENAADASAGVTASNTGNEQIDTILSDLVVRETKNFSLKFRGLVASRLAAQKLVSREPARSAAFKVLRQSETPSVLVELGFMTNPDEVRQMQSEAWQLRVARALAAAVDAYFGEVRPQR